MWFVCEAFLRPQNRTYNTQQKKGTTSRTILFVFGGLYICFVCLWIYHTDSKCIISINFNGFDIEKRKKNMKLWITTLRIVCKFVVWFKLKEAKVRDSFECVSEQKQNQKKKIVRQAGRVNTNNKYQIALSICNRTTLTRHCEQCSVVDFVIGIFMKWIKRRSSF